MIHHTIRSLTATFVLACTASLCACGGGSSGPLTFDNAGDPGLSSGRFTAQGPVSGLRYTTASQAGVTDADGTFQYVDGESVQFAIGDQLLGEAVAARAALSPLDLVPGSAIPQTRDELFLFKQDATVFGPTRLPAERATFAMINLLSLLQSLDQDKDTANGIQLHAELGMVQPSPIDIDRRLAQFRLDPAPRLWLYAAFNASACVNAELIPWPKALDAFAAAQGVEPDIWVRTHSDVDLGNNGSVDLVEEAEFDSNDLLLFDQFDVQGQGASTFDIPSTGRATRRFTRDAAGRILTEVVDSNDDGTIDQMIAVVYDAHGRITEYTTLLSRRTMERDSRGLLTRTVYHDNVGTITQVDTYAYDALGREIRFETDNGNDGSIDRSELTSYSPDGRTIRQQSDRIVEKIHDENGLILEERTDGNANGSWDHIVRHVRDNQHRVVKIQTDAGANGTIDSQTHVVYDHRGRILRFSTDGNNDGTADSRLSLFYSDRGRTQNFTIELQNGFQWWGLLYDLDGFLTRVDQSDGDAIPDHTIEYEPDVDGNAGVEFVDEDADGTFERSAQHTYRRARFATRFLTTTPFFND